MGAPTIVRRDGRSWSLPPIGSALLPYPKSQHVDINARDLAGGRRALAFQQSESAVDGLAARGRSGLVGDGGRAPERVPGQRRPVTGCLFGDGDERRQRGGAPP